jgi:hypothetical protein
VLVGEVSVPPGTEVAAPGVCRGRVGVANNKVGVLTTGGAGVAGEAQPASRKRPINKDKRALIFMLISSADYYILLRIFKGG